MTEIITGGIQCARRAVSASLSLLPAFLAGIVWIPENELFVKQQIKKMCIFVLILTPVLASCANEIIEGHNFSNIGDAIGVMLAFLVLSIPASFLGYLGYVSLIRPVLLRIGILQIKSDL